MRRRNTLLGVGAIAALALFAYWQLRTPDQVKPTGATVVDAIVAVQVPAIEGNAAIGKRIFDSACAACHGADAAGTTGIAPPLVHKIYEPSHHGDEAFQRAAANGVKAHHWKFGDMPPVSGLTRGDVTMIITYIRELQRANGIH